MSSAGARGRLVLVPNLLGLASPDAVLPQRTIAVTRTLRHVVVENAKPARQFLATLDMPVPLREVAIEELTGTPDRARCRALLAPALAGMDVGLLSDAGCPAVADPGALLVAAAHELGVTVLPLVGPSAILLALMASGMNGQSFTFHGYLPVDAALRRARLQVLDDAIRREGATQLFIETPYRNDAMLASILEVCRGSTVLCVAIDLTTAAESITCRTVAAWKRAPAAPIGKRPAMFVLGGAVAG